MSYIRLYFAKMSRVGKEMARLCERLTLSFITFLGVRISMHPVPDRMKLTCHRVTFAVKSQCGVQRADRTKQNVEAEHQDDARAHFPRSPRTLVESKRNKRATRARMQNNAPRRARPSRRNPSPRREQIDRSIHFGPVHTRDLAFGERNPAERLNSTADSRRETRVGGEREKERCEKESETRIGRRRMERVGAGAVSLRVRSSGTSALGILDI